MASNELGSQVNTQLTALNIDTISEVEVFRALERVGDMKTTIDNIAAIRGEYFISRKRVRHDALRLYWEGAL